MSNILDKWLVKISSGLLIYLLFYMYLLLNHELKSSHLLLLLSPITIILLLSTYAIYYLIDGVISHSFGNQPILDLLEDISIAKKSLESKGFKFPSK